MATRRKEIKVRSEFPGDGALQQVHLARKALQEKAKSKGMSLGAYIRSLQLRGRTAGRT
jgi:hypothetical protein